MLNQNSEQNPNSNSPEFATQRIYIKDASFEAPNVPEIFKQEWNPEAQIDLNLTPKSLEADVYEVTLKLTVTVKNADQTAFLAETVIAGIFTLRSFPSEQINYILHNTCATILFPYASEFIADLVRRGSFPPLFLPPVNFEALYQNNLAKQKAQQMPIAEKDMIQ